MGAIQALTAEYFSKTPLRLKVIDCFMLFSVTTGFVQLMYMNLAGTFPFNSFLAGFISCLGTCTLTACLRTQANPANKDFDKISPERAFADYAVCILVLHLAVFLFMG